MFWEMMVRPMAAAWPKSISSTSSSGMSRVAAIRPEKPAGRRPRFRQAPFQQDFLGVLGGQAQVLQGRNDADQGRIDLLEAPEGPGLDFVRAISASASSTATSSGMTPPEIGDGASGRCRTAAPLLGERLACFGRLIFTIRSGTPSSRKAPPGWWRRRPGPPGSWGVPWGFLSSMTILPLGFSWHLGMI